ncbi:MAG: hypothetical protein Q9185_006398 [Variospora sp. 1 TL-2023]
MDTLLTADLAANAPRFRRKSSTYVDAIHDLPAREELAPAQLYSTESGRLFHSGRIAIATVGLPARGKTKNLRPGEGIPDDYFFVNASPSSVLFRQKILKKCREDIYHFLNHENGQIAIYDAVNPTAAGRRSLAKEFAKHDVETLFIESACTDERIIEENVRSVKISSPDYVGWSSEDAVKHYLSRMSAKIPHFETMEEQELNYIKVAPIRSPAGTSRDEDSYKTDAGLSDQGRLYAEKMGQVLLRHRDGERRSLADQGGTDIPLKPLKVWTSTRRRTVETANWLYDQGYSVRQRTQLSALNPGVCERMSEERIRAAMPDEVAKHEADPYHHRYPRAEASAHSRVFISDLADLKTQSYHDLAVRLEPIILELERQQEDLLIIAHESVLRVLYGYLMACNATDIPSLSFPRNEIIEIMPASYNNEATRIPIPDLPTEIIPSSPEDLKIPVPPSEAPSGTATPLALGSPETGPGTPRITTTSNQNGALSEPGEGSLLLVERALRG